MINTAVLSLLLLFQTNVNQDSLLIRADAASGSDKVYLLNELCRTYLNNRPDEALKFAQEALTLAESIGDSSGIASSHNNIGLYYKNKGILDKALMSYMLSAEIQERNNLDLKLANTHGNMGTIYSIQGEYNIALDYFQKAATTFEEFNRQIDLVGALNNLGNVYMAMQNSHQALFYYDKALIIYEELPDNSNAFVPFESIGNIYFQRGDLDAARTYYQSAYDLDSLYGNENGMSSALHNIGVVFKKERSFDKAFKYFNSALTLAQNQENTRLLSIIYQSMAEAYFESGDGFMAYSFLRLHDSAKDSLFNEESNRLIAQMESMYEMDKMERELESLQLESELQQLRIKNDKIIILAIIVISIVGVSLTAVIIKELRLIKRNKKLVEDQKSIIEEKNKSITYSIDYAKSMQKSLLNYTVSAAKRSRFFVLFEPKDIVSGDFYWYKEKGDVDILAVADCTGHGVAGAFMTVVGHAALEQIINRDGIDEPAEVLQRLNVYVQESLKNNEGEIMDHSMDIALCKIQRKTKTLTFAGINRPLIYCENGELTELKGTKVIQGEESLSASDFENHCVEYNERQTFYIFSDGYPDQFGGPKNKKYMIGRFKKLLTDISELGFESQKHKLKAEIQDWKGENEQTDDIAILGFKP